MTSATFEQALTDPSLRELVETIEDAVMIIKGGTEIEYTYALGGTVQGRIVKPSFKIREAQWYQVRLNDEAGEYGATVHESQIRIIDNRPNRLRAPCSRTGHVRSMRG